MPRDGAVIFGDLEDKLEVLQLALSRPRARPRTRQSCWPSPATHIRAMIEATVYPVYTSKNQRSKLDIVRPVRRAFPDLLRLKI